MPLSSLSFCAAVSNCCMAIRNGFRSSVMVVTDLAVAISEFSPLYATADRQTCEYTSLRKEFLTRPGTLPVTLLGESDIGIRSHASTNSFREIALARVFSCQRTSKSSNCGERDARGQE